jgi:hypothetical protein
MIGDAANGRRPWVLVTVQVAIMGALSACVLVQSVAESS